jgi:hypothetical protein
MPASMLARTPFPTWVVPGLLLALCVAVPAGVVAFGAATRRTYAHPGHPLLGLTLMGWILVQVAVIGPVSALQPVMFAWGLAILLLGWLNYRRWHCGWGATPVERTAPMAGDDQISEPDFAPTRAITIDAPPEAVWPWLVQMGYGRAGWYSYDLLDNRGRRSAERIEPRWQDLRVGDPVPMSGRVDDRTAFRVAVLTPYRVMVWSKADSTWSWQLRATPAGGTRLVTRVRARYAGLGALLGAPLMEIGDFPMMRRCLLGIKARAECSATQHREPAVGPRPLTPAEATTADKTKGPPMNAKHDRWAYRFKRWMYPNNRPNAVARVLNSVSAAQFGAGFLAPRRAVTLDVPGWRSGRTISCPLVLVDYEGDRYLVSMLGRDVNWVRNVQANNGFAVVRHRDSEPVRLIEVDPAFRAPILRRYLDLAPGARPHVPVDRHAPLEEFARVADQFPVFLVKTARSAVPAA